MHAYGECVDTLEQRLGHIELGGQPTAGAPAQGMAVEPNGEGRVDALEPDEVASGGAGPRTDDE